jgi:glycosyltransferase involved in cell wall biosynthesis
MAAHVATAGQALRLHTEQARGVLHVLNSHGGGTERHVLALIDAARARHRHYVAIAVGDDWRVEDHGDGDEVRSFEIRRLPGESWPDFLRGMAATFGIQLVHLHNISGCRTGLVAALAGSAIPYGYTVHDLGFACPTVILLGVDGLYCGGETDAATCTRCLEAQPTFAGIDIVAWRSRHRDLLAKSAFVIAPSQWAAATLARYFPGRAVEVIPHGAPPASAPMAPDSARAVHTAMALPNDDVPTVAVLGAIGPHKGARRLERMVELVRNGAARVRFVVVGYLDVQHDPWQSDDALLTVHGPYDSRDLARLLDQYRVGLVLYPSAAPETFSFTLSEAWAAGRPVVVPPIGALAVRVEGSGAGWVWTDDEFRREAAMLARIAELLAPARARALAEAARCARAMPQPALADMAQRTVALYDDACAGRPEVPEGRAFPAERVRAALADGTRSPPAPAVSADGKQALVGGATQDWWRTLVGRTLGRAMPAAVRNALRRRQT